MSESWVIRTANEADLRGLGYLWLKSSESSRDARDYGVGWWEARSPLVDHLLRTGDTRVLCDREDPAVFWAFACFPQYHEGAGYQMHYACVKREFWKWRERIQTALLTNGPSATMTHELTPETGIVVPETWKLDRYWGWR